MISLKFVLSSHQAKTMTTKYQQPVTSTPQLEEFRCKGLSLSTLSEGHQRQQWSESAAGADGVSFSSRIQEELVFVEDVYRSQERQTASFLFVGTAARTQSSGPVLCARETHPRRAWGWTVLLGQVFFVVFRSLCFYPVSKFHTRTESKSTLCYKKPKKEPRQKTVITVSCC